MAKDRAIVRAEGLKKAIDIPRSSLAIGMGVGKTLLAYQYIYKFFSKRPRVLVVIPNTPVIKTYQEEAIKHKCLHVYKLITFTTYLSLHKQHHNYDLVILEEVHSLLYTHDHWLSQWKGRILGLTGTPPPDPQSEKGIMLARYCPVVYTYLMDEAVEDGILNDYKIVVHLIPLSKTENILVKYKDKNNKEVTFYSSEQKSYKNMTKRIAKCGADAVKRNRASILRMSELKTFHSKEEYAKKLFDSIKEKCILFCNTKEQARKFCHYSFYSGNPESERNLRLFNSGAIMKLAAINQLSQSINIKGLRQGIIMYIYSRNSTKFAQRLARLVRLLPKDVSTCHVLVYKGTIEEQHMRDAVSKTKPANVSYTDEFQW